MCSKSFDDDDDDDVEKWDHVSELRPPLGLPFIPQVTYEHREPWWNSWFVHQSFLVTLPPESYRNKPGGTVEGNY
jgi:hypothetical protein